MLSAPDESTYLIVKQNEPFKLIFLDLDVGMVVGMIMLGGFLSQTYVLPMLSAAIIGYTLHYVRTNFPRGFMTQYFMYWLMPPVFRPLRATPPSLFREFIG